MIRIITDSTSDIDLDMAKSWGIEVMPLHVLFAQEEYIDGINLSKDDFYKKLTESEVLPTTSQINPDRFKEIFKDTINNGDSAVVILLSSELSGTYQSAAIAKNMVDKDDKIKVIDSRNVTFGLAMLVKEAVVMRDAGKSADEIESEIISIIPKVRLFAAVDTLKYLKLGGRISSTTAFVGGLMGILPIVSIVEGKVEAIGKARGKAAALKEIYDIVSKDDIDTDLSISFGNTNSPDSLAKIVKLFEYQSVLHHECFSIDIGCIVGTHAGPGACGIGYFIK